MARKRKSTTRRRRRSRKRGMSEGVTLSRRGRRKGTRRRRRRGLSEAFTVGTARSTGIGMLSGAVGGFAAGAFIPKMLGKLNTPGGSLLAHAAAAFLTGAVLGMPNVGAGIAGAYGAQLGSGSMGEMDNFNYADQGALNEMPDALDENGNAMYLAEDGNFYYLEELADDPMQLAQMDNAYPSYVNSSQY